MNIGISKSPAAKAEAMCRMWLRIASREEASPGSFASAEIVPPSFVRTKRCDVLACEKPIAWSPRRCTIMSHDPASPALKSASRISDVISSSSSESRGLSW